MHHILTALLLAVALSACVSDTLDDPIGDLPQDESDTGLDTPDPPPEEDTPEPEPIPESDVPTPPEDVVEDTPEPPEDVPDPEPDVPEMDPLDWVPDCEDEPCPLVIEGFPFADIRDTRNSSGRFDRYACAPNTNEAGPEFSYIFKLDEPGTIVASVVDDSGVDIDLHLLDALDPAACLARNDTALGQHLQPGIYYLVADTWTNSGGTQFPGEYELSMFFLADSGPCGMNSAPIPRISTDELLDMPATGPVVLEAHLVTQEEHEANIDSGMGHFPTGWPQSFTDRIENHYTLSESISGFSADRGEPWAPCCEPSNEFGQGSSARPPAAAEAWYINMRWRQRPERGERYIVFNPFNGKAVVGAAGYENGPGDLSRIGGACEEIHVHLDTRHLDPMTFGQAKNQNLEFGPIDCY